MMRIGQGEDLHRVDDGRTLVLGGVIIEELSSTHLQDDSFYTDETINANRDRKTLLSYWMD